MKKQFILFAFAALTTLAACNSSTNSEQKADEASAVAATSTETTSTAAETVTSAETTEASTEAVADVAEEEAAGVAVMTFTEEMFDFGKITQGEKVTHTFKFKNEGDSPLIITDAKTTCGCTVPDYPKNKPIAPGEGGEIVVTFNSAGKQGKQEKPITLSANVEGGKKVIRISGEVQKLEAMEGPLRQ